MNKNVIKQQREHFDSIAREYYEAMVGDRQKYLRYLIYKELFKGIKFEKKQLVVLEEMCGWGEGKIIAETFIGDDIIYEGFDYSEEIVKCALEHDKDINIYVQDVTTFETEKKYDVVILLSGLHHVPDYSEKVVAQVSNMLDRGGAVY